MCTSLVWFSLGFFYANFSNHLAHSGFAQAWLIHFLIISPNCKKNFDFLPRNNISSFFTPSSSFNFYPCFRELCNFYSVSQSPYHSLLSRLTLHKKIFAYCNAVICFLAKQSSGINHNSKTESNTTTIIICTLFPISFWQQSSVRFQVQTFIHGTKIKVSHC